MEGDRGGWIVEKPFLADCLLVSSDDEGVFGFDLDLAGMISVALVLLALLRLLLDRVRFRLLFLEAADDVGCAFFTSST